MKREDILKAVDELGSLRDQGMLTEEEFQKETRSLHELLRQSTPGPAAMAPVSMPADAGSELFSTGGGRIAASPLMSSSPSSPSSFREGDVLMSRYRLKRLLGEGGMGQVFLAHDQTLGRDYALKVIRPELSRDPSLKERFLNELRLTEELTHPGIVRTYALLEDPASGQLFFTMEYVEGDSLNTLLEHKRSYRKGKPPLKLNQAMSILNGLSETLMFLHEKDVIHRDIKPSNIILTQEGEVKLMDFGIARQLRANHSDYHTAMLGSVYYMAPEQHKGTGKLSPLADVFSLGVLSYELLTGELPMGRALPPSTLNDELPEELDEVILQAIDPREEERTASVEDFWKRLRNCLRKRYNASRVNPWRKDKEARAEEREDTDWDPQTLRLESRPRILSVLRSEDSNKGIDLHGCDLSKADLSGIDFRGVDLTEADLSEAMLQDANLSRTRLVGANLTRANLKHANLREADLSRAVLDHADLALVKGDKAVFNLASGEELYCSNAKFPNASFHHVQFPKSTWFQADLSEADFTEAVLSEGQFWKVNATSTNFHKADVSDAEFREATLNNANFTEASLKKSVLTDASMQGTILKDADCRKTLVEEEQLEQAEVRGAKGLGLKRKWLG